MTLFEPCDVPPAMLRKAHLDSLPEHQECFLEELVRAGRSWCSQDGAFVVAKGTEIVAFHADPSRHQDIQGVFDAARQTSGAASALCLSYDRQLLFAALSSPARVTATGIVFRSMAGRPRIDCPDSVFRRAEVADLADIAALSDDFFDDFAEVARLQERGQLHALERDGVIVGSATQIQVTPWHDAVDLGMVVAAGERNKGYGAYMITRMRDDVLARGLTPVCACAARNVASWRALLKAGFVDDHRLLRIEF